MWRSEPTEVQGAGWGAWATEAQLQRACAWAQRCCREWTCRTMQWWRSSAAHLGSGASTALGAGRGGKGAVLPRRAPAPAEQRCRWMPAADFAYLLRSAMPHRVAAVL